MATTEQTAPAPPRGPVTPNTGNPLTKKQEKLLQRKLKQLLRIQAQAKALYKKMDGIDQEIIPLMVLGEIYTLEDGRQVKLAYNYEKGNVAWKSTAFRQFEIEEVSHKNNGRSSRSNSGNGATH